MVTVQLIYDEGCPNVDATRTNLVRAFSRVGMAPKWTEHRSGAAGMPAHARGYGSPTILVDGADVAGEPAPAGPCCRLYRDGAAPDVELIAKAIRRAQSDK